MPCDVPHCENDMDWIVTHRHTARTVGLCDHHLTAFREAHSDVSARPLDSF